MNDFFPIQGKRLNALSLLLGALIFLGPSWFPLRLAAQGLTGAWLRQEGEQEQVLTLVDGYFILASYGAVNKQFAYTWGGPYQYSHDGLEVRVELDTKDASAVGSQRKFGLSLTDDKLALTSGETQQVFQRVDNGQAPLAGVWRINGRKQGDQFNEIALGPRRTLKILSGTHFQWAAINVATGEFFGTGGGTYEFADGHYTETIRFFSRDSSRVGSRLRFDGKLVNGDWHHSGLSSKGDPIYEVWTRLYKP